MPTDDEILTRASIIDSDGSIDLSFLKADYYNAPLERFLSQKLNNTSFSVLPIVCENTVTLTDGHGAVVGNYIEIWEGNSFEQIEITAVNENIITLAIQVPYPYSLNAIVYITNIDLNVDGSTTPVEFTFKSETGTYDVTRFLPMMTHDAEPDDSKLGGIAALTPAIGCVFDNVIPYPITAQTPSGCILYSLSNVTSNYDLRLMGYDLMYSDRATPQGAYSTALRKTMNGDDKSGTVFRVFDVFPDTPNADTGNYIRVLVRADLTGLGDFRIKIHGHLTNRPARINI